MSKVPLSSSNTCARSVHTYMCSVVVLTGSWPTSGSNANVFSFQQGVDHIIQKGHLDHRRIHILGLQHLNTHIRSSSYSLQWGLKNSRIQKCKSNLNEKGRWIQRWRYILFHQIWQCEGGEKKPAGLMWGMQQSPLITGACSNHKV